jgi:hypothetical protein
MYLKTSFLSTDFDFVQSVNDNDVAMQCFKSQHVPVQGAVRERKEFETDPPSQKTIG